MEKIINARNTIMEKDFERKRKLRREYARVVDKGGRRGFGPKPKPFDIEKPEVLMKRACCFLTSRHMKKRDDITLYEVFQAQYCRLVEREHDEQWKISKELCEELNREEPSTEDDYAAFISSLAYPATITDIHLSADCSLASCHRILKHQPALPFFCEQDSTNDRSEVRHCHFRNTFDWKAWKRRAVGELGLETTPWFEWIWRKRFRRNNVYTMQSWPRGHCIIIGNIAFGDAAEKRECYIDLDQTRDVFLALHFDCVVAINLKAQEIKDLIDWAAHSTQQERVDCLVVVLMSHGVENHIYGTDFERVHLYEDVYEKFNNENCPQLQGKPKLFFVQACRGGKYNNGASVQPSKLDSCPLPPADRYDASPPSRRPDRTSSWSDMYIVYATIPGFVAHRNEETGSWLLSAMHEVFLKHAHHKSLDWLMRSVSAAIRSRSSHDGSRQTVCIEQLGWTKKLYFNPGRMGDPLWKDISTIYKVKYFEKYLPSR